MFPTRPRSLWEDFFFPQTYMNSECLVLIKLDIIFWMNEWEREWNWFSYLHWLSICTTATSCFKLKLKLSLLEFIKLLRIENRLFHPVSLSACLWSLSENICDKLVWVHSIEITSIYSNASWHFGIQILSVCQTYKI